MRNLERLSEAELTKRAKELYFNRNPKIDVIYADEFGRFSYNQQSLVEQNEASTGVFAINRKALNVKKDEQKEEVKPNSIK